MEFNPMNFIETLPYLGKGMLGIFVVMGVIIVSTVILNRASSGKKEDETDKTE